ncbi:hypothetical protein CR513_03097, partial [Mucuna pruriens]
MFLSENAFGILVLAKRRVSTLMPIIGENKSDAYLDWEMKIEKLFACHNIHENLKVMWVILEFSAYALVWLYQIIGYKIGILVFTLGKYKDEVLCDKVPIEATHILLVSPWQYDRKLTHDMVTNKFMFVHRGQKVTLKPLSPKEVDKD